MFRGGVVHRLGHVDIPPRLRAGNVCADEKTGPRFPLLLTTGRILSQYNVGAQTRRTANIVWHPEDVLEIHPTDAENRGLKTDDWVRLASRKGETTLRALVTDRVAPGVGVCPTP